MIKHVNTECEEFNFLNLEKRVLTISNIEEDTFMQIRNMLIEVSSGSTLIMATGGSKVVACFLQTIIEELSSCDVIVEVIEPRDYFYKRNSASFDNLIAISASGKTNGIKRALEDFDGKRFLICEEPIEFPWEVISWGNGDYIKEKSFISLASSLGPMAAILKVASLMKGEMDESEIDDKLKMMLRAGRECTIRVDTDFKDISLIQVISGYDTKTAAVVLESNLVEVGLAAVVVHEKGEYCHGRSNLLFRYPDSFVIYLSHQNKEIDDVITSSITHENYALSIFDTGEVDMDMMWREYYLALKMYFLSKKIADDKGIDLSQPEYNPNLIKRLYPFRGEM